MRDLKTVFSFEFSNKLRQKSIMVTTVIILAILFLITCIPTISKLLSDSEEDNQDIGNIEEEQNQNVYDDMEFGYVIMDKKVDSKELENVYPFMKSKLFDDESKLVDAVKNGDVEKGIILYSLTNFKLIANDISMYDMSEMTISENLRIHNRNKMLLQEGINPEIVDEASNIEIQSITETFGKNAATGFAFAYVGMFIIYFVIILYGNSVSTSVAREKNDRTMELLITNTSSTNLIWGKVLASTVLSILQLASMIVVALLGIKINEANYPEFVLEVIKDGMALDAVGVFLIFAFFGTLMYYFLFAAVGALVSKVEEVNSAMTPIQFIFMAAFFLSSMGMNMPDSLLMRIVSIVPFSSPMAMFIRYSLATVPVLDIIFGVLLLILTTVFMAHLAIRIYRMGTLNYGNKIGFVKAVSMVFTRDK